jgi:hypothetical protein
VQVFAGGEAFLHSGMYTFDLGQVLTKTPKKKRLERENKIKNKNKIK